MTQKKTKVSLVISSLEAGGAERVMSLLANNWAKKEGIEVELVILSNAKIFYKISSKVKIIQMGFPLNNNGFLKILNLAKLFWKLRRHLIRYKPEVVLSFMTKYNIFVLLSLYKSGINIVISERDSPTEKISKLIYYLKKYIYGLANGAICQTEMAKAHLLNETMINNAISIPNPVNVSLTNSNEPRHKIILNVGRLVPKKGHKYLLHAFSRFRDSEWNLVFLGDGKLKKELQELSAKLEISNKVLFNGTTRDISEWYLKSSIFAFPSILEGYPNALAEAMCYGLACVSFDCNTGPSEMIEDGVNGFLIEERNIDQLSEKMEILMEDEQLRIKMSREASKLRNVLNEDLISDQYLNFCLSVNDY